MTNLHIPQAAVTAAKIAWGNGTGPISDDDMRAVLAAAYPHMMGAQYRVAPVDGGWAVQRSVWIAEEFYGFEAKAVAEVIAARDRLIAERDA